jgi:hypothetical protein
VVGIGGYRSLVGWYLPQGGTGMIMQSDNPHGNTSRQGRGSLAF